MMVYRPHPLALYSSWYRINISIPMINWCYFYKKVSTLSSALWEFSWWVFLLSFLCFRPKNGISEQDILLCDFSLTFLTPPWRKRWWIALSFSSLQQRDRLLALNVLQGYVWSRPCWGRRRIVLYAMTGDEGVIVSSHPRKSRAVACRTPLPL